MSSRPTAPGTSAAPPKARPAQLAGNARRQEFLYRGAARGSGRSIGVPAEAQLRGQERELAAQVSTDRHYVNCPRTSADAVWVSSGVPAATAGSRTRTAGRRSFQAAPLRPLPEGIDPGVAWTQRTGRPEATGPPRCTRLSGGRSHHKSSARTTVSRTAIVATNNTPANTAPGALPPSTEATSEIRKATAATDHARMPACLLCIPWFPCPPHTCSGRASHPVNSSVAHCRQPRYCNSGSEARDGARRIHAWP